MSRIQEGVSVVIYEPPAAAAGSWPSPAPVLILLSLSPPLVVIEAVLASKAEPVEAARDLL